MKVLYLEPGRCLGCRNCERVCAFQKGGGFKLQDANIWVMVDMEKRSIVTLTCRHCKNAPCLAACPSGALERDPLTNAVVVNAEKCLGCHACIGACPFGSIHFDDIRGVAVKCDLCGGDPKCVHNCMALALHYGEVNELAARKRQLALHAEQTLGNPKEQPALQEGFA